MPRQPLSAFLQGHAGGMSAGQGLASGYNSLWQEGMGNTAAANLNQRNWLNKLRESNMRDEFKTPEAQMKVNAELNSWGDQHGQSLYVPGRMVPELPLSAAPAEGMPPSANTTPIDVKPLDIPKLNFEPPQPQPGAPMPSPSLPAPTNPNTGTGSAESALTDAAAQLAAALGAGQQRQNTPRSPQLPDYSNMSFGQAHRTANTRGDRVFVWRGKRYNSRYSGDTPGRYDSRMQQNSAGFQRSESVMPSGTVTPAAPVVPVVPILPVPSRPRSPIPINY